MIYLHVGRWWPRPTPWRGSGYVSLLTTAAMVAFAANSVLCRAAFGRGEIDAASFSAIRLLSGALALAAIHAVQGGLVLRCAPVPLRCPVLLRVQHAHDRHGRADPLRCGAGHDARRGPAFRAASRSDIVGVCPGLKTAAWGRPAIVGRTDAKLRVRDRQWDKDQYVLDKPFTYCNLHR